MSCQRRLAEFSQPMNFLRVETQAQKGIFVVLADPADVRPAGPFQTG